MNRWLVLACAVVVALTLVSAPPAGAAPPECEFSCTCSSKCSALCLDFGWVINCGTYGTCQGLCQANVPEAAAQSGAVSGEVDPLLERVLGAACDAAEPQAHAPLVTAAR